MAFTGDASQLKAATADAERAVESVGNEVDDATAKLNKHSNALERDAEASRKAAQAAREREAAEKAAREQVERATGVKPSATPGSLPKPASAPAPSTIPGTMPSAPTAPAPGMSPDELEKRRAAYIPLLAAQREYEKHLAVIRAEEQAGVLSAAESSAAAGRLARSYDAQVEAIKKADPALKAQGQSYKLAAHEMRNLNYQVSDIFTSLAGGMPVQMILFQQGPQIIDIFGGIGNAGRAALAALTPLRVAFAGVTAAAVLGGMAYNDYLQSQKEVETAARGLGRAVAGSSADMEASARSGAATAGITVANARSMEAAFLRTGRIGHENYEALIGISKDFAATMGISADEAGTALAEMFADPAKAAEQLYRQYGLINGATAEQVRRLAAQNDLTGAQAVLVAALPSQLADASQATTGLGRAWDSVATSAGNAWNAIGQAVDRAIDGPSALERIRQVQQALDENSGNAWENSRARNARRGAEARAGGATGTPALENTRARNARLGTTARDRAELDILIENQRIEERRRFDEQQRARRQQMGAAASLIADQSPVNSSARQREVLTDQIAVLERGQLAESRSAAEIANTERALAAKTRALQTMMPEEQRSSELAVLDLQIQKERNVEVRAGLVAQRARLQLAGQEITPDAAEAKVAAARKAVVDQANAEDVAAREGRARALDEMLDRQRLEVSLIGKTAQEQALLRQEYELSGQVKAEAWARNKAVDENELLAIREKIQAMRTLNNMQGPDSRGARFNSAADDARAAYQNPGPELDRMNEEASIRRAALRARSPAELAEVARRRAALQSDPLESGPLREARINDAGLEAREQAEKSLTDARLERNRALQQSLESEQLEISLIGKTAGEAERLRMIFQLTAQLKEEAARNGTKVDEAELTAIRQKAAEYGRLADMRARTEFRNDIQFEFDQLGRSDRDQGIASRLKGAGFEVDLNSQEAQLLRQIEVLKDVKKAWEDIRDTGRDAVDQVVESGMNGFEDIQDVFQNISKDILKQLTTLAVANPLKNAIFGDALPTTDSVGGIAGIFSALTGGKNPALQSAAAGLGSSVGAMTVSAGTVMVNGGVTGGNLLGGLLGGGTPGAGVASARAGGGASGAVDIASQLVGANENANRGQINSFLKSGGVDIDAASTAWCAGFVNASLEKVGIKGSGSLTANSFQGWGSQVDVASIMRGDVLLQSRGLGAGQMGGHVGFATGASRQGANGLQLEMLSGNSSNSVTSKWVDAMGLQARRATETATALAAVPSATGAAVQGLGALGNNLGSFSQQLLSAASGANSPSGGILGSLGKMLGGIDPSSMFWAPNTTLGSFLTNGFDSGGWTGDADEREPVGVVHGREFVVRAPVVARPGVRAFLQALNDDKPGFARGGFVGSGNVMPGPGYQMAPSQPVADNGPVAFTIENHGAPVKGEMREERDANGRRRMRAVLDDQNAAIMSEPGTSSHRALQSMGLPPFMMRR